MNEQGKTQKIVDIVNIESQEIIEKVVRLDPNVNLLIDNFGGWGWYTSKADGEVTLYHNSQFREKPKKRWVDITHECEITGENQFILHNGNFTRSYPYRRRIELVGVIEKDAKIIIEKEVEG